MTIYMYMVEGDIMAIGGMDVVDLAYSELVDYFQNHLNEFNELVESWGMTDFTEEAQWDSIYEAFCEDPNDLLQQFMDVELRGYVGKNPDDILQRQF